MNNPYHFLVAAVVSLLLAGCGASSSGSGSQRKYQPTEGDVQYKLTLSDQSPQMMVLRGEAANRIPKEQISSLLRLHVMSYECSLDSTRYYNTLQSVGHAAAVNALKQKKGTLSESRYLVEATKFDSGMAGGRLIIGQPMKDKLSAKQAELQQRGAKARALRSRVVNILRRQGVAVLLVQGTLEIPL